MNDSDMRTSIALDLDLERHWICREIQSKWEQIQWPIDECVETLNKNYIELNDNSMTITELRAKARQLLWWENTTDEQNVSSNVYQNNYNGFSC